MDIFPKNKQFSFTTKLNHPIQVQKEQWVVALVEIMTPSEVYNISHNSNYFYVHFYDENVLERLGKSKMNTVCMKDGSCPEIKLFVPAGNYNSPQHLVEQIQIAIEEKCGAILRQIHSMITLSYKKSGNRVNLHVENPNRVQRTCNGFVLQVAHFYSKKSIVKKSIQNDTKWYLRISSLMSTIYFFH